jgi:spore photoproduct lyase
MTLSADRAIQKIYITRSAEQFELTAQILSAYPTARKIRIASEKNLADLTTCDDPKRVLLLTCSKGEIVKDCPGTAAPYLCCRYQVINQTINCPLDCTYCILQYYLNQPATIIYTDYEKIVAEIRQRLVSHPDRFLRFGTGELGDSLALSASRLFAGKLIKFFASAKNTILELKTKSDRLDAIIDQPHNGHTILSWSLNPLIIKRSEERLAATPKQRLSAAAEAVRHGFPVGFHFDPIIDIPDWERHYLEVIDELYNRVDPRKIAWISLGSLRFPPSMKDKIIERYPRSKIPYGELIRGQDQKMRYFRHRRVEMYRVIYQKLTEISDAPFIYFCMESPAVWQAVFGFAPQNNAHLDYLFAESLWRRFPGILPGSPRQEDYRN